MTGRDAIFEFVRSRVVELSVERPDDLVGFEDKWAKGYTDDLIAFLESKGFDIRERDEVPS